MPKSTPDSAVYVMTLTIPVEGQTELKALTFFINICRQNDSSLEKQISHRQLPSKTEDSNSWLVAEREILYKYELPKALELLNTPPEKIAWKRKIFEAV